jgi:D-alanyl-D-alanine dipeptidase
LLLLTPYEWSVIQPMLHPEMQPAEALAIVRRIVPDIKITAEQVSVRKLRIRPVWNAGEVIDIGGKLL